MACHVAEEVAWKCPKHPSKSRSNGVCPSCLRDRLGSLCPVCANVRPCGCVSNTTSSSSSSSSSFSFFNNGVDLSNASNFSEAEPSLRRSRSVAIPFLRSDSRRISTPWFLRKISTKKSDELDHGGSDDENIDRNNRIRYLKKVVTRSRSVSSGTSKAVIAPGVQRSDLTSSPAKWKLWHFPSPMKVFRSSKPSKSMENAPREFSIDIVEQVFRNFTLKECCTVTILGIMPWLNISLSSKTWVDVWSMNLGNLDCIQEKRDGKNDPKCQKVQRLMELCAKYGVMPEIRTEMGHPLKLVLEMSQFTTKTPKKQYI